MLRLTAAKPQCGEAKETVNRAYVLVPTSRIMLIILVIDILLVRFQGRELPGFLRNFASAARFCRAFDELRQYFRPRHTNGTGATTTDLS